MATIDPVIVKLEADITDLQRGLQQANGYLKDLDTQVKKADSAFAGMSTRMKQVGATIGITFGASQLISFFKESVAAAQQAEAAQARLRNLLLNTNGATEEQIVALGNQAKALEKVGVVSADNVTVAQSQLATFDLSAAAIGKLTPAVLNYVTAEKGATASADDFKQMTNSLALALNGQYGSLSRVGFPLTDLQKKMLSTGTEMERATALTEILNSTYNDFNENLRKTSEGLKQVAMNDLNNLKQQIGEGVQPVIDNFNKFLIDTLIPTLSKLTKFLVDNKDTIIAVVKVLLMGVAAFTAITTATKIYQAVLIPLNAIQKIQIALNLAQAQGLTRVAAAQLLVNDAIKKMPLLGWISLITAAVAIVVTLWKESETFRKVVIVMAKAALTAFAAIVPMVAQVYEAIAKTVTGPLRLLLLTLSKLPGVGKIAQAGLELMDKGLNSISDLGDKASKKATELTKKLDGLAKSAKNAGKDTKSVSDAVNDFGSGRKGGGGLGEKDQKKLDGYKKKVQDIYKDMNEVIADANEKAQEALDRRNERMLEAEQRYQDTKADLEERYAERMADAQERYDETVSDLKDRRRKADELATKKYTENVLSINADFRKREIELIKNRDKKIDDLMQSAERKRADITKAGQERLASIVESSRDRLRDAFAKATEFNIQDMFSKGGGKKRNVIDVMRQELASMQTLQKAAGELAGAGYSQTFIEEIVKAGPKAGMRMVAQIKKLSPEQQTALRDTYKQLESMNKTGMDGIAETLSDSSRLATTELQAMYAQTSADIATSLAMVDAELKANIAETQADYLEALAEATATRDERLAEAKKTLDEALAQSQIAFNESLAEADKTLKKAQEEAKNTLDKGLLEAQKILQRALLDAQKDYETAIDEINKSTQEKLDDLMAKLREVAAAMNAISAGSGAMVVPNAPSYTPIVPEMPTTPSTTDTTGPTPPTRAIGADGSVASWRAGEELSMANLTFNQTFNNVTADAWDIHERTLSAIRYGTAITPRPNRPGGGGSGSQQVM